MTVLSKQYSLIDTINLRLRDQDNFDKYNPGCIGQSSTNIIYEKIYQIARDNPNMSFQEFMIYTNSRKIYSRLA